MEEKTVRECRLFSRGWACLAGIALLQSLSVQASEDYSQWAHSKDLYLDTSPAGADIKSDLDYFPVLVRLNASNFDFSQAKGAGQDIRFSDPVSGELYPYEIELWDSAGAKAAIWVGVEKVLGNRSDRYMRMHWGHKYAIDIANSAHIFTKTIGYAGVWHMAASGNSPRLNSVPQGLPAKPVNFGASGSRPGLIATCDSLGGEADVEPHFSLGSGYADFSAGFTFSAWVHPGAVTEDATLLDLGDGEEHNIRIARAGTTDGLQILIRHPPAIERSARAEGVLVPGGWQHIAVTIAQGRASIWCNGKLLNSMAGFDQVYRGWRASNFLGRSGGAKRNPFQGLLDEVRLSNIARSADWIKLSYENQRSGQVFVKFGGKPDCASAFQVPADTVLSEGGSLELRAEAVCAERYEWAPMSGPVPRILDPISKSLFLRAPRISGDTTIVYSFTAHYADSVRTANVRILLREAMPDPDFRLPDSLDWDGRTALEIRPVFKGYGSLPLECNGGCRFSWTLESGDMDVDTTWSGYDLRLAPIDATGGTLRLGLCLENGGATVCQSTSVLIRQPSAIRKLRFPGSVPGEAGAEAAYDFLGRLRHGGETPYIPIRTPKR